MKTGEIPFDLLVVRSLYSLALAIEELKNDSPISFRRSRNISSLVHELGGFIREYDHSKVEGNK